VELPGADGPPFWEHSDQFLSAIREFLHRIAPSAGTSSRSDRAMATLLFTDIVGSTDRLRELGDRAWRELIDLHNEWSRRRVREFEGRIVEFTGDGMLATFDGPGRGIACARRLGADLEQIGLRIRAGLHTGEIELRGDQVAGAAVHIAARVMAMAGPDEILVTRTIRDLITGSDLVMHDRGSHVLKGIEGDWQLFAVDDGGPSGPTARQQ
jgi:class 3 adenylate cyclase